MLTRTSLIRNVSDFSGVNSNIEGGYLVVNKTDTGVPPDSF